MQLSAIFRSMPQSESFVREMNKHSSSTMYSLAFVFYSRFTRKIMLLLRQDFQPLLVKSLFNLSKFLKTIIILIFGNPQNFFQRSLSLPMYFLTHVLSICHTIRMPFVCSKSRGMRERNANDKVANKHQKMNEKRDCIGFILCF